MNEKDELDEEFNEFSQVETIRALKFNKEEYVSSNAFKNELKAKYRDIGRKEQPADIVKIRRQKYCELIVGGLKAIVEEIRSSKVFMGSDGFPMRRMNAKTSLKKADT
jgi:hypothetical protein